MDDAATQTILEKFLDLQPLLDERARRVWAATEARALGWGGIARVAEATGMSRVTIANGLKELAAGVDASDRQRAPGAGRKRAEERDPGLAKALERLVDPATRGDPAGPLLWTSLSAARLAAALQEQGRQVSERTVNRLLHEMGYSLQSNRKTLEGRQHPDRDAQFNHVNRRAKAFHRSGDPVVSVDTKKKELGRGLPQRRARRCICSAPGRTRSRSRGRRRTKTRYRRASSRIIDAAFSPIMMAGALVFPETRVGMIEASATRRPRTP